MTNIRQDLKNNFEKSVFLKGYPVLPREAMRYIWAYASSTITARDFF